MATKSRPASARAHLQRAECHHLFMIQQRLICWYVHDAPEALKLTQIKALAADGQQRRQAPSWQDLGQSVTAENTTA